MKVLGISGRYRDAAAALAVDGRLIAAVSEDCFTKVPGIGYQQTGGFPSQAVEACLLGAGLELADVDQLTVVEHEGPAGPDAAGLRDEYKESQRRADRRGARRRRAGGRVGPRDKRGARVQHAARGHRRVRHRPEPGHVADGHRGRRSPAARRAGAGRHARRERRGSVRRPRSPQPWRRARVPAGAGRLTRLARRGGAERRSRWPLAPRGRDRRRPRGFACRRRIAQRASAGEAARDCRELHLPDRPGGSRRGRERRAPGRISIRSSLAARCSRTGG